MSLEKEMIEGVEIRNTVLFKEDFNRGLRHLSLDVFNIGVKDNKIEMVKLFIGGNGGTEVFPKMKADCYAVGSAVMIKGDSEKVVKYPILYGKYIDGKLGVKQI